MTEEQHERRLEREAHTVRLGVLGKAETATDTARVEVTYQETWDSSEHCGFYIVHVRCEGVETLEDHPAELARQAVLARAAEREYEYFSVDDVYAA